MGVACSSFKTYLPKLSPGLQALLLVLVDARHQRVHVDAVIETQDIRAHKLLQPITHARVEVNPGGSAVDPGQNTGRLENHGAGQTESVAAKTWCRTSRKCRMLHF